GTGVSTPDLPAPPAPADTPGQGPSPAPHAPAHAPSPAAEAAPAPAPPPTPVRKMEPGKDIDPAQEEFETLKRHIHTRLIDRLDMNRISEIDPKTLRNEIRGVVELLCDTENPLLNRNERQRLVNEILDETFGFGPLELLLKDEKIGDI